MRSETLWVLSFLTGCFPGPGFQKQTASDKTPKVLEGLVVTDSETVTARYDPRSSVPQLLAAPESGNLSGTELVMQPGALSIAVDVTITEGIDVATTTAKGDLGFGDNVEVETASKPVAVLASQSADLAVPFTLSLPLSSGAALALAKKEGYYTVFYQVEKASQQSNYRGAIPTSQIVVEKGFAKFQASYFGIYQLAVISQPVLEVKEAKTQDKIVVLSETKKLDPFQLDDMTPIAAASSSVVTLSGKNFRPSMRLAVNGRPVSTLTVKSDAIASFKMPASVSGFVPVSVEQDGKSAEGKLYAMANRTDYPLITMSESGVCSDVTYYDASGNLKTGTRTCTSATVTASTTSTSTGDMTKAVYDQNGDAVVDSSQFSFGAQGSAVTASSTLDLPEDGSFYVVSSSGSTATVSSIASMPVGTRIALGFGNQVKLQPSTTLVLQQDASYYFSPGDVIDLISVGSGVWRELARSASSDTHVEIVADAQTVSDGTSALVQYILESSNPIDTQNEYSGSSHTFKPHTAGTFSIQATVAFDLQSNSCFSTPYLQLKINGTPQASVVPDTSTSGASNCLYTDNQTLSIVMSADDELTFYMWAPSGSGDVQIPASGNRVVIRRI